MWLLMGCKQKISFTCESPCVQQDFRLFFSGLSDDIIEMPANGELHGKDFPDIDDKIVYFFLVYKGNLVYFDVMYLENVHNPFNLSLILHSSQLPQTNVLEIIYKNKKNPKGNNHSYVVLNLDKDECQGLQLTGYRLSVWEKIKESMN